MTENKKYDTSTFNSFESGLNRAGTTEMSNQKLDQLNDISKAGFHDEKENWDEGSLFFDKYTPILNVSYINIYIFLKK